MRLSTLAGLLLLCLQLPLAAQNNPDVDKLPEFPGGTTALMTYLVNAIKYPESARSANAEGMVVVKFVVRKNGKIKDISGVSKGAGQRADLTQEAIRVVKSMPKWTPAEKNGKKLNCEMVLPIKFRLE